MHYTQTNVTTYANVVDAINNFATAAGWTHPFTITADTDDIVIQGNVVSGVPSIQAKLFPVVTSAGIGTERPSKVTVFGGMSPVPWIGAVLTYEYNYYRHIYIGNIEPLGGFTGGEVVSITNGPSTIASSDIRDPTQSRLFGAMNQGNIFSSDSGTYATSFNADPYCGGAYILHSANPTPWRKFSANAQGGALVSGAGSAILGGFNDGPNDTLFARANGSYASAQVMVPINLYIPNSSGLMVPVGAPSGVRYVDMTGLVPEQEVTIGSDTYRVYPDTSKQTYRRSVYASSGTGRQHSSGMIGYAYPENPA